MVVADLAHVRKVTASWRSIAVLSHALRGCEAGGGYGGGVRMSEKKMIDWEERRHLDHRSHIE